MAFRGGYKDTVKIKTTRSMTKVIFTLHDGSERRFGNVVSIFANDLDNKFEIRVCENDDPDFDDIFGISFDVVKNFVVY